MEELSGLAVSRTYPGIVWGHGDSGQPPVLWALDLERGDLAFPPYLAKKFDDGACVYRSERHHICRHPNG